MCNEGSQSQIIVYIIQFAFRNFKKNKTNEFRLQIMQQKQKQMSGTSFANGDKLSIRMDEKTSQCEAMLSHLSSIK